MLAISSAQTDPLACMHAYILTIKPLWFWSHKLGVEFFKIKALDCGVFYSPLRFAKEEIPKTSAVFLCMFSLDHIFLAHYLFLKHKGYIWITWISQPLLFFWICADVCRALNDNVPKKSLSFLQSNEPFLVFASLSSLLYTQSHCRPDDNDSRKS